MQRGSSLACFKTSLPMKIEHVCFSEAKRGLPKGAFLWENQNPDSCVQKRILRFFT